MGNEKAKKQLVILNQTVMDQRISLRNTSIYYLILRSKKFKMLKARMGRERKAILN